MIAVYALLSSFSWRFEGPLEEYGLCLSLDNEADIYFSIF